MDLDEAERRLNLKTAAALGALYVLLEEDVPEEPDRVWLSMALQGIRAILESFVVALGELLALAVSTANAVFPDDVALEPEPQGLPLLDMTPNTAVPGNILSIRQDAQEELERTLRDTPQRDRLSSIRRTLERILGRLATTAREEGYGKLRKTIGRILRRNKNRYRGWVWIAELDERTCPVCYAMHGREFRIDTEFFGHVMCRCRQEPVLYGEPYGGGVETGARVFDGLDGDTRRRILGKGKHELYEAGGLMLPDLVGTRTHPEYGRYRYERSLRSLRGR